MLRDSRLGEISGEVLDYLSSREADRRIFQADLLVDRAHLIMLKEQGWITLEECTRILQVLGQLRQEDLGEGEDVHEAIEAYVKEGRIMQAPARLTPEMKEQAGVFVSIHKGGELRGCIGTFEPSRPSVAEEIIINAISAATRDPRFEPVQEEEIKDLDISVDVLTAPEPIESKEQLNPKMYGAIVQRGARRGLLLPDLEGVDTAEQQIEICRMKADIAPDEKVRLYRFEVKRYH